MCVVKTKADKVADNNKKTQVEGYLSKIFSGRISRANYFVGWIIVALGIPIATWVAALPLSIIGLGSLALFAGWIAALLYFLSFNVRRFHDTGRNTIEVLWIFVPIVNFYFLFLAFFKGGDEKKNEYGPAPNRKVDIKNLFGVSK